MLSCRLIFKDKKDETYYVVKEFDDTWHKKSYIRKIPEVNNSGHKFIGVEDIEETCIFEFAVKSEITYKVQVKSDNFDSAKAILESRCKKNELNNLTRHILFNSTKITTFLGYKLKENKNERDS